MLLTKGKTAQVMMTLYQALAFHSDCNKKWPIGFAPYMKRFFCTQWLLGKTARILQPPVMEEIALLETNTTTHKKRRRRDEEEEEGEEEGSAAAGTATIGGAACRPAVVAMTMMTQPEAPSSSSSACLAQPACCASVVPGGGGGGGGVMEPPPPPVGIPVNWVPRKVHNATVEKLQAQATLKCAQNEVELQKEKTEKRAIGTLLQNTKAQVTRLAQQNSLWMSDKDALVTSKQKAIDTAAKLQRDLKTSQRVRGEVEREAKRYKKELSDRCTEVVVGAADPKTRVQKLANGNDDVAYQIKAAVVAKEIELRKMYGAELTLLDDEGNAEVVHVWKH